MAHGMLNKKVAVITGASSGIGRGAALMFAEHGARVVLGDIDEPRGKETANLVAEQGGQAVFATTDVTSPQDVQALIQLAITRFGRLDCAFNNAGIEEDPAPLHESTEQVFDHVIAVDMKGVWLCMRSEIPAMLDSGGGAIVNTSSAVGTVGIDLGLAAYVAAKHGVIGLTKAAALEYATRGIRVNAVCPGGVRTPRMDQLIDSGLVTEHQVQAMQPLSRLGQPAEVAEAAAWLCSDRASFITGHALAVDGGFVAR